MHQLLEEKNGGIKMSDGEFIEIDDEEVLRDLNLLEEGPECCCPYWIDMGCPRDQVCVHGLDVCPYFSRVFLER